MSNDSAKWVMVGRSATTSGKVIGGNFAMMVLFVFHVPAYKAWWRHQMETFYTLLALCVGILWSPVNSPHKGRWRGALVLSLICAWTNGWVNNRGSGDLRRHRAHNDVTVMLSVLFYCHFRSKKFHVLSKSTTNSVRFCVGLTSGSPKWWQYLS